MIEHSVSPTRQSLQEQLDSMAALVRRLSDGLHKMTEERDSALKSLAIAEAVIEFGPKVKK